MNIVSDISRYRTDVVKRLRCTFEACRRQPAATARQLWDAVEATGEMQLYDLGQVQLPQFTNRTFFASAEEWLPDACVYGVAQVESFAHRVQLLLRGEAADSRRIEVHQSEIEKLIGDRMRFDAAVAGLEWILGQIAASQRSAKRRRNAWEHRSPAIEKVYLQYGDCLSMLNDVDELIEERPDVVSSAARGNTLNEARALIHSDAELPLWLDGTLELLEFAKTQPRAWRVVQPLLKGGVGQRFREAVFDNVDAIGPPAQRFKIVEAQNGKSMRMYEWKLSGPEGVHYRLQLITPSPSRRPRVLEMRVANEITEAGTAFGRQPNRKNDCASPSWLAGRLMILEGVVFRWIEKSDGSGVEAKTTAAFYPGEGPLVLVDCASNKLLEPFGD